MPLIIEATTGSRGKIIRRDEREDSAVVWLVCEEAEGPSGGLSLDPEEADEIFPMAVAREPVLVVDTQLLDGELRFTLARFVRRALDLLEEGESEAVLSATNAAEWGLIPTR